MIQQIFWTVGEADSTVQEGYAHAQGEECIIALSGSFAIVLDDGIGRQTVSLNRPDAGLYIPPLIWRRVENTAPGAVCLILASLPYEETDYIRDPQRFAALHAQQTGQGLLGETQPHDQSR